MNKTKQIWQFPWKFIESFIILATAIIIAFLIDYLNNSDTHILIKYPYNVLILSVFIILSVGVFLLFKENQIVKWISSVYLAISSIILLLFFVILMGVAGNGNSGIINLNSDDILFSKSFFVLLFFILSNLLFVIIKRFNDFSLENLIFIINHLGLFILIVSLSFGAGDIQKHRLKIYKEKSLQIQDGNNLFEISLLNFEMEMFPAKIAIVENKTDKIIKGNNYIISTNTDSIINFGEYQIKLKKYLKNAVFFNNKYHFVNEQGASPAANLIIKTHKKEIPVWISCGSYIYPSKFYELDSNYTLVMLEPEPKSYKADVKIAYKNKTPENITLQINKPVNIANWDFYLSDYDKNTGQWSDYIIVEIVKDKWLNFVYLGIFLMILGAIGLIFKIKSKN